MSVTIELWNDTGYTESGVERPPIGATLSSPDLVYYDLNPQRNNLFSSVQIKAPYTDLYKVSYLRATYDFNESDPLVIYGWVDSVALVSDTDRYPSTQIDWHVDLWRTYARNAVFRAGTVHRRPLTSDVPPQPYPFRYKTPGIVTALMPQHRDFIWWIYVDYVEENESHEVTTIKYICFPVSQLGNTNLYISGGQGIAAHKCINWQDVITGQLDEHLGIAPSTIISASLSPIPPAGAFGTGAQADPIYLTATHPWMIEQMEGDYWVFRALTSMMTNPFQEFTATLDQTVRTDDIHELIITGLDGAAIGELPWGISVKDYTYRMVDEISAHYIQIRFGGKAGGPEGLTFTTPLPAIPITSNSWSEYVYSGQREYDIRTRQLQTGREMVSGLTGAVTTGINAWQMQSLSNMNRRKPEFITNPKTGLVMDNPKGVAYNANLTRMAGMTGAAAMGAVVASTVVQGMVNTYFNGEYQKWEDYAQARQTDNIILPGGGGDVMYYGLGIAIVDMVSDDYSVQQRNTDIQMYGAHVTEPLSSCQSLVLAGGPLQITNMTVGGNIPVEAKEYIRAMFSNGVRLV